MNAISLLMKNRSLWSGKAHRLSVVIWAVTALLMIACGEKLTPEEKAMNDAKEVVQDRYDDLLAGRYASFLSGRVGVDSLPEDYREQLVASCAQFMAVQKKVHGGVNSFLARDAQIDSTQHLIQVFLQLNYADSTQEVIVVPMVEHNGKWKMK
jgi:uncharacterized protein YdiU (UPF0061 family)